MKEVKTMVNNHQGVNPLDQQIELEANEDFVYRFKIEDTENTAHGKPFEDLFKNTISELLKYVTFFNGTEEVNVTDFAFRNDPKKLYKIHED